MEIEHFRQPIINNLKSSFIQAVILFVAMTCMVIALIYEYNTVYKECYAEAGVEVKPQDFFKVDSEQVDFTEGSDRINIKCPGEYQVILQKGFFKHKSTLYIQDTIAPTAEAVFVNLEMGEECEASDFVTRIEDATEVKIDFKEKPDFTRAGRQQIKIGLTDMGENETVIESELFISQVFSELTVEAGCEPPKLEDFVIEAKEAEFLVNIEAYNYTIPADRTVALRVDGTVYKVIMHIVDTVPPAVQVQDLQGYTLLPRMAEDFIVSAEDVTKVTVDFKKAPDVTLIGEQDVEIKVVDAGSNEVIVPAKLTLEADTEAPIINGVTDLNVIVGGSIAYKKNVTVTDNCQEGLQFSVDNSAVNLNVEGIYPVVYKAKDFAGNETSITASVTVKPRVYTESEIYALADSVLARIISPGMTPMEKVQAIYNFNKSHISYISHSEKGNWLRAAYEGFVDGKGDCYVYACTAKALLIRAGITNMDIIKIPSKTSHYWNLVNLGEGWYHFDTTPRKDRPTIFMWTEAQMMDYSAKHNGSHNYDHSLYPAVN